MGVFPHVWPSVFSPTLSRVPRTGWEAPLWLGGLSPNRYSLGGEVRGPWSLGRRKVPNARCWYTQGDCLYSEAEQQSAPSLAAATLHVEEAATSPLPFFLPVLFPSLCNEVPSSLLFSQSSYGPGKANPPLWQEAEVVLQERTGEVPPLPSRQSFSGKLCIWCGE